MAEPVLLGCLSHFWGLEVRRWLGLLVAFCCCQCRAETRPELVLPAAHRDDIVFVAVAPDARWFVTAAKDGTIHLRRATDGELLREIVAPSPLLTAQADSARGAVISSHRDARLRAWDVKTGDLRASVVLPAKADHLSLDPVSGTLAASVDHKLLLFDALTLTKTGEFDLGAGYAWAVALFNEGKNAAVEVYAPSGGISQFSTLRNDPVEIAIVDLGGRQVKTKFTAGRGSLTQLEAVKAGGADRLALSISSMTGTGNGINGFRWEIQVRDALTGNAVSHALGAEQVAFAAPASAETIYVSDASGAVMVRRLPDLQVTGTIAGVKGSRVAAVSADSRLLVSANNRTFLAVDLPARKVRFENDGRWLAPVVRDIGFNAEGELVVVSDVGVAQSQLWRFSENVVQQEFKAKVAALPEGAPAALVISERGMFMEPRVWMQPLDMRSGIVEGQRPPEPFTPLSTKASAGGDVLVSWLQRQWEDGDLLVWRFKDGKVLRRIQADYTRGFAIAPQGNFVAQIDRDQRLKIHGITPDKALVVADAAKFTALGFGREFLAAGTADGRVLLVDPGDGRVIGNVPLERGPIAYVAVHGSEVLAADEGGTVSIVDLESKKELNRYTGIKDVRRCAWHPNQPVLVIADGTATLHVLSTSKAERLLTLRLFREESPRYPFYMPSIGPAAGYLAATPEGLFDGTEGSWDLGLWHFGTDALDARSAGAFFADFFSPGLVNRVIQGGRPKPAITLGANSRRQPLVSLTVKGTGATATVEVTVSAVAGVQAKDLRLFRNGVLVESWRGEVVNGPASKTVSTTVQLAAGRNDFTAYAFNGDNVRSDIATGSAGSGSSMARGTAHVLAIGVDQYRSADLRALRYAVTDAETFAAAIGPEMRFQPKAMLLKNGEATRERILKEIARITREAKPDDAVLIFFAGHGVARGERYYLLPNDADLSGEALARTAVSDGDLERELRPLMAGTTAVIIDACQSGQAMDTGSDWRRGPINATGFAQLAYEKGIQILAASQSYQSALEPARYGHGLLTYALVKEGLEQRRAINVEPGVRIDRTLSIEQWFEYASLRVTSLVTGGASPGREVVKGSDRQQPRAYVRRSLGRDLWLLPANLAPAR